MFKLFFKTLCLAFIALGAFILAKNYGTNWNRFGAAVVTVWGFTLFIFSKGKS